MRACVVGCVLVGGGGNGRRAVGAVGVRGPRSCCERGCRQDGGADGMADGAHEQLRLGASQHVALYAAQHCIQSERMERRRCKAARKGWAGRGRTGADPEGRWLGAVPQRQLAPARGTGGILLLGQWA
jgi:hypothetical protein